MVPNFNNLIFFNLFVMRSFNSVLGSIKSNWYILSIMSLIPASFTSFWSSKWYLDIGFVSTSWTAILLQLITSFTLQLFPIGLTTPTQNSLQSIRTCIFPCDEIAWFHSICTVYTNLNINWYCIIWSNFASNSIKIMSLLHFKRNCYFW